MKVTSKVRTKRIAVLDQLFEFSEFERLPVGTTFTLTQDSLNPATGALRVPYGFHCEFEVPSTYFTVYEDTVRTTVTTTRVKVN